MSAREIENVHEDAPKRDVPRTATVSDEPGRAAKPEESEKPTASAPGYYDQIGGAPTIRAAVDAFYERVLKDPDLASYFTATNMPRLKRHQVQLLTTALGGPDEYQGRDLAVAHRGRGITGQHYAKVAEHLAATLRDLGAPAEVVTAVSVTLDSLREQIVEPGAEPAGQPRAEAPQAASGTSGQEAP
ncbi:group I truncated hemoglobin [Gandjariella thermophila]|uniref:Group 1 truncated hemoglobin n=1 Tax=Gandjariella thermophila TaxID=1931992 RepID=A0A4D4J7R5_9PSEU|nr:group 1 truncated hemoglobin [Gandjariella thermophila]GDY31554.1 hypothetical protein GTS_31870 [Gandjariella thermophila]